VSPRAAAESSRPYHHGNLAQALVDAALALLEETQDWAFSLREVARRAGVSHNAPYKHFPEKRDLLAAVATRGFEALAERAEKAARDAPDARTRLMACGQAYISHALANPALYRLMFSAALTTSEAGRPAFEREAAAKAKGVLDSSIEDLIRLGAIPSETDDSRALGGASLAVWAALHGLVMLAIDDFVGPPAKVAVVVEPVIGALLAGFATISPTLPKEIWVAPRL